LWPYFPFGALVEQASSKSTAYWRAVVVTASDCDLCSPSLLLKSPVSLGLRRKFVSSEASESVSETSYSFARFPLRGIERASCGCLGDDPRVIPGISTLFASMTALDRAMDCEGASVGNLLKEGAVLVAGVFNNEFLPSFLSK